MTQCTSIADSLCSSIKRATYAKDMSSTGGTMCFFHSSADQLVRSCKVIPKLVHQNSDRICRILQVVPNGPLYFPPSRSLAYLLVFRSCDFAFSCKHSGRCEPHKGISINHLNHGICAFNFFSSLLSNAWWVFGGTKIKENIARSCRPPRLKLCAETRHLRDLDNNSSRKWSLPAWHRPLGLRTLDFTVVVSSSWCR